MIGQILYALFVIAISMVSTLVTGLVLTVLIFRMPKPDDNSDDDSV